MADVPATDAGGQHMALDSVSLAPVFLGIQQFPEYGFFGVIRAGRSIDCAPRSYCLFLASPVLPGHGVCCWVFST